MAGLAIALKPANGLFIFAPLVAFALARRWRAVLEFGVALIPALLTLAVWKYRGTGISVLALDPTVLAAAAEPPPHPTQLTWWEQVRDFVPLDIHQLNHQFLGFREYFWSARLLEFIPVAGAIAVARRSIPKAAFFVVWLAAFFVVKGSSPSVSVETATIWRLLMPAWPAYFFLAISIPLLVPVWGARLPERFPAPLRVVRWPRRALIPVAILLAIPLIGSALLPPSKGQGAAKLPLQSLFLPVDQDVDLAVAPGRGRARPHVGRAEAALRGLLLHRLPLAARVHAVRGRPSRDPPGEALRADRTCAAVHDRDGGGRAHAHVAVRRPGRPRAVDVPDRDRGELAGRRERAAIRS